MNTSDKGNQLHDPTPTAEILSYSSDEVDLTRRPIDWDLDPETLKAMSPEEREAHMLIFHEQARRLSHAITDIAKGIARLVPPDGGVRLDEVVDRELNPDKYPITPETPQVGPPEPLESEISDSQT